MYKRITARLGKTLEALGKRAEEEHQRRLVRLLGSLVTTAYRDANSREAVTSALERVLGEIVRHPAAERIGDLLDVLLPPFVSDPANADRFARLLQRVLPDYLGWGWSQDSPLRRHFDTWQASGFNLLPNHHYVPIPDLAQLAQRQATPSKMVGIDLNEKAQLALLSEVFPLYREEFEAFAIGPNAAEPHRFFLDNPTFREVDAHALHALIRHHRPQQIVEVGAGYSTLCSAAACTLNRAEGQPCEFICIEPFPNDLFEHPIFGLDQLLAKPLEEVGYGPFESLGENDILFIDSTHVVTTGNDVAQLYLEILPRLRPGVLVHVHDIFLPADYPRDWITQGQIFWNEQYLFQAFLSFNSCFEVIFAAHCLHLNDPDALTAAVPGYDRKCSVPGSFWIRRTG